MDEMEIVKTGGPLLVAVVLLYRIYFDSRVAAAISPGNYNRDIDRLEKSISKIEDKNTKSYECFTQSIQNFTTCVNQLSGKLDLHAKTLEIINGNLEAITERLTHLERRN